MTQRLVVVVAALTALALPAAASAHANLVRTVPADRAALSQAPGQILVVFDDVVRVGPGNEAVRNGAGSILAGAPLAQGKTLALPLRSNLGDGDYSVRWSIISDDGHEEQGVLAFAVGSAPPPVPTLRAGGRVGFTVVLTRWLFFSGLLMAAGLALFDVVVWRPVARRGLPTGWIAIGLAAVFVSASALVHQTHAGASTRFGLVIVISAGVAAAGATAAAVATVDRTAAPFALVLALALLPAPTLAGHSLDAGRSWVDAPIDFLHVLAVAFWLGGLAALAVIVPRVKVARGLAGAAARRFSRLALVAVLLIAATGVGRALAELWSVSQLWTTGYGRALVVKTALFGVLVVLGWLSRSRLAAGYARLRASVASELVVLLGLLVAVGVLTALPPGRTLRAVQAAKAAPGGPPKLPPPDATVVAQRDGHLAATVAVRPSGATLVTFIGPDANTADVGPVTINGRPAGSCGVGCYTGTARPGRIVTVAHGGTTLRFDLGLRRPASGLVLRATHAYRRLHSAVYWQRIASGLGPAVVTIWKEVAPDELSYDIANGASAIVIGKNRWDRLPGQGWQRSTTVLLPMPVPLWGERFANAQLLRTGPKAYVVSFLSPNAGFPAWFTVTLDRRTLHPLSLTMTAAAHFMRVRYLSWNRPIKLRPPS